MAVEDREFTMATGERSSTKNISLEASYMQRPINIKMPTFNAEITKKELQDKEDKTHAKTPRIKQKIGSNDRQRNIKLTSSVLNPNRRHDLTANGPRLQKYADQTLFH